MVTYWYTRFVRISYFSKSKQNKFQQHSEVSNMALTTPFSIQFVPASQAAHTVAPNQFPSLTLRSPVVTICTTSLTFNNSTFCPHSVFMCFVWISEQTAIISLYSIDWLVFITETECVYCAVRTGCLYIYIYIYVNIFPANLSLFWTWKAVNVNAQPLQLFPFCPPTEGSQRCVFRRLSVIFTGALQSLPECPVISQTCFHVCLD